MKSLQQTSRKAGLHSSTQRTMKPALGTAAKVQGLKPKALGFAASARRQPGGSGMWHICLMSWFQPELARIVKKGPQCFLLSVHISHFGQGSPLWAKTAPVSCCMSPAQHNAALPEAFQSPCHQEQNRNVLPCGSHR